MSAGLQLLLASVCYNATFCDYYYDNTRSDEQLTKRQQENQKLRQEINGKHLKIGTYQNYPASWTLEENGTLRGYGAVFVIIDMISEKLNFTYDVVIPSKNYLFGGEKPEDSLIGLVNSTQVDVGAAFIPILFDYRQYVTFGGGLDEGTWLMMLKRPKESAAGSGLLAPFEYNVWYIILVAVLIYGPCITFLTRLRSKLLHDEEEPIHLSPSCWFVYGAFIKQGTTLSPDSNTTRVLFATWWIFIILLSAFYTANLTAFLTLSKFTLDVEYPMDLYKKNYRWVAEAGGAVEYVVKDLDEELYILSSMVYKGRGQFREVTFDTEYLRMVSDGAVLVSEDVSIYHLMYADYVRKTREGVEESDRCTYVAAPNPFMKRMKAFAYPKNSTLKTLFEPILTNIVQAGMMRFLLNQDLPSTKICPLDLQSKDRRLRNTDLLMTYLIMAAGLSAATAVFIGEVFYKRYYRRTAKVSSKGIKKRKPRLSTKVKMLDDSRPPPYESLFGKNSKYKSSDENEYKIVNGREYYVVNTISGEKRLIPLRTPSAFLYDRKK